MEARESENDNGTDVWASLTGGDRQASVLLFGKQATLHVSLVRACVCRHAITRKTHIHDIKTSRALLCPVAKTRLHSSCCVLIRSPSCPPGESCGVLNTRRPSCPTSQACRRRPPLNHNLAHTNPPSTLYLPKTCSWLFVSNLHQSQAKSSRCSEPPHRV